MPNIASILKDEIVRLARKELRSEVEGLRKTASLYRSEIAALKRRVAALEHQQARLTKAGPKQPAPEADPAGATRFRFSAKGFATYRQKLGLSAVDLATLLGVSNQTIYHWESGKTRPRQNQLVAIAGVRKLGKKAIRAALQGNATTN